MACSLCVCVLPLNPLFSHQLLAWICAVRWRCFPHWRVQLSSRSNWVVTTWYYLVEGNGFAGNFSCWNLVFPIRLHPVLFPSSFPVKKTLYFQCIVHDHNAGLRETPSRHPWIYTDIMIAFFKLFSPALWSPAPISLPPLGFSCSHTLSEQQVYYWSKCCTSASVLFPSQSSITVSITPQALDEHSLVGSSL